MLYCRFPSLQTLHPDRYSLLPHFTHRTRFLISVQLPLLEFYHARISSSLDAFESLSAAFVRAVPGALGVAIGGSAEGSMRVDTGRLTAGIEGVQRLCKALVSARSMEAAMDGWGEELVSIHSALHHGYLSSGRCSFSSSFGPRSTNEPRCVLVRKPSPLCQIRPLLRKKRRRALYLRSWCFSMQNWPCVRRTSSCSKFVARLNKA